MWGSLEHHLAELRARLVLVGAGWLALGVLGWVFHPRFLDWLVSTQCANGLTSQAHGDAQSCAVLSVAVTGGIWARLWVSGLPVVLGGVPLGIWQGWLYFRGAETSAATESDRNGRWAGVGWLLLAVWVVSIGLTAAIAHPVMGVLVSLGQPWVQPLITIESTLGTLVGLFLGVNVLLFIPAALAVAMLTGLIRPDTLGKARRGIVLVALIVAALVTPTTDPLTMLAVAAWPVVSVEVVRLGYQWRARRQHQRLQRTTKRRAQGLKLA